MPSCIIEIEVNVTYEYTPAVEPYISGLPEDCYPGTDELVEITEVELVQTKKMYDPVTRNATGKTYNEYLDILAFLSEDQLDDIEAQILAQKDHEQLDF